VFADDFVRRAHGERYRSWHPILDEVLADTHGIMVYQEDVMKVAVAMGGFSVYDGDQLRKVLSKKHKARQLQDYQRQFYQGAAARNIPRPVVDHVWEMMMSFAGYSFCKPHSASYAQVSFKSAYLRAHYPAEFLAAVISNQGGYYSAYAYLSEGRRMGLHVLPPDINASDWAYRGADRTLRVGLMQLKGVREAFVKTIIEGREQHGPYRSLRDFVDRVKPESAQATLLIKAGCLDSIAGELTRPGLIWRLHAIQSGEPARYVPIPPEYDSPQQLAHELEIFGFPLIGHPLERYCERVTGVVPVPARELARYVGRTITLLGWLVTEKIVTSKKGEPMEFVTFEDQTSLYDATFFPDTYRRYCHVLGTNQAYVVTGVVEEHFGTVALTVTRLELLSAESAEVDAPLEEGVAHPYTQPH
jgi:error-prone DNA polymerase